MNTTNTLLMLDSEAKQYPEHSYLHAMCKDAGDCIRTLVKERDTLRKAIEKKAKKRARK